MNELKICDCSGGEQTFIYWDRVRKFMDFSGMSFATLARKSRIPESTLRKLMQGVTKDPRISTVQPIFQALDLDANVALGLLPPRDYDNETRENVPLTDALRQQLAEVRTERDAQLVEMDRLRKLVLSKGEALCRLEGRAADVDALTAQCADQQQRLEFRAQKIQEQAEEIATLNERIAAKRDRISNLENALEQQRKEQRHMRIMCFALIITLVLLLAYFAWEISNLDRGLTAPFYSDIS